LPVPFNNVTARTAPFELSTRRAFLRDPAQRGAKATVAEQFSVVDPEQEVVPTVNSPAYCKEKTGFPDTPVNW
jgi:hypothetical protein